LRNNIYVGNLASIDEQELEQLISPFGIVRYAAMDRSRDAIPGTRFGVVEMQTENEAEAAIKALNGSGFRGRALTVRWATPPEQTACGHPAMWDHEHVKWRRGRTGGTSGPPREHDMPIQ
jgi:cold-inducible RNA-binding protein